MAILSISAAAKAAGISRQGLYNYVKDGKISVTVDNKGCKGIDTSEIIRVFGEIKNNPIYQNVILEEETKAHPDQSTRIIELTAENAGLKMVISAKDDLIASQAAQIETLKGLLPRLLEEPKKKGFFERIFS